MADGKPEYTVVARRYRPRQFADLIGQEPVAQALRNALTSDRVAHAYLFTGARGVGKTSAARILAKALNCEKGPTVTPCDKCSSCIAIASGDDIDVREIDGASNNSVEDVRALRQDVSTRPTRGRYKIYIIDEVHMLSISAFNALLKTLEEPPPHVKFIFATTNIQKVPITILSRCQRFDFGLIKTERIAQHLRAVVDAEKMTADDDALEIIARRAAGSMRDAQSLLDQLLAFGSGGLTADAVQKLLGVAGPERVLALTESIFQHDAKAAVERLNEFADGGLQLGELLDQLVDHWRDLMLVACAGKDVTDLNTPARHREALFRQASSVSLDTVLAGLDILVSTKNRLKGSGHLRTLMQMAVIRLCRLEDLAPLSQLAYWVSQPGSAPAAASGGRQPPVAGLQQVPGLQPGADGPRASGFVLPPEAKKKADPAEPAATVDLTSGSLPQIWPEILADVGGILAKNLECGVPAILGPKALAISFGPEYTARCQHCALPENVQRVETALRQRTGSTWTVRLDRAAPPSHTNGQAKPAVAAPRMRPHEAMQRFPLLQRALDVFQAIPMALDPGFGEDQPPPAAAALPQDPDTEEA
jgi:DNA polymerase-3 subunit gamma/tau